MEKIYIYTGMFTLAVVISLVVYVIIVAIIDFTGGAKNFRILVEKYIDMGLEENLAKEKAMEQLMEATEIINNFEIEMDLHYVFRKIEIKQELRELLGEEVDLW